MRRAPGQGSALAPWLALLLALLASGAWSQESRVQIAPGPHYVGEPIQIRVSIQGFDEDPVPDVDFDPSEGGVLRLGGVSPSVSTSISIINGQVSRSREVNYIVDLFFEAQREGRASVGPIRIVQSGRAVVVSPINLDVEALPTREGLALEVLLPERPIYVGERAPVRVRLRLTEVLQQDMESYTLRVPLFEEETPFQFLDSDGDADTQLVVTTGAGPLRLRGTVRRRSGEVSIEATRTLVPLSAGRHEIAPATLLLSEGVSFQRDLFGGRRATRVRKWSTESAPVVIDVRSIPVTGRPPSFAGTVGRGFALSVAADRSVVRVGDPIALRFELRGEGLETAALPPLAAEGLLSAREFRVPVGELVGEIDGDVKRFTASVRVTDEEVTEIPSLAFSWFDPETERFETTHTRPIALSVSKGRIVGADDVARAGSDAGDEEEGGVAAPVRSQAASARPSASGADLSIERAPERLLRGVGAGGRLALGVQGVCYAGGLLLVALAWRGRRRSDEDPALRARRRRLAEQQARIAAAARQPPDAALETLADALRRIRAEVPDADGAALEALVGECEELRYAPEREGTLDADLVERAGEAARRFVEALP